jgi:DNA-directed RNA polymerase specialized sigma24 family protein
MTYQEIANELGISMQSVWETEQRAMAKLRIILIARGITLEDFLP